MPIEDLWKKLDKLPAIETQEYLELGEKPVGEVGSYLRQERGVTLAGKKEAKWIKSNPDSPEALLFKSGATFYFFGKENEAPMQLRWDGKSFQLDSVMLGTAAASAPWRRPADTANDIPRRVVTLK